MLYRFQSPPDPEAGCDCNRTGLDPFARRFNPHPTRRPGATSVIGFSVGPHSVSIPTRPGGRVRRLPVVRVAIISRFNPHPTRRPGATLWAARRPTSCTGFNPHPTRRPGATSRAAATAARSSSFNPHPTRRPGATRQQTRDRRSSGVSIPTRPGGRVRRGRGGAGVGVCVVSIPTRPGGRVRRGRERRAGQRGPFQSPPDPEAGCDRSRSGPSSSLPRFNPHPTRRPGATAPKPCFGCREEALRASWGLGTGQNGARTPSEGPPPSPLSPCGLLRRHLWRSASALSCANPPGFPHHLRFAQPQTTSGPCMS